MHAGDVIERVRDLQPAWQDGDIGDETDVAHELIALGPGIASENAEFSLKRGEAEDSVESRRFAGAVGTDDPEDAAIIDAQVDAIECDGGAEAFAESVSFYARHGFTVPPSLSRWNSGDFRNLML